MTTRRKPRALAVVPVVIACLGVVIASAPPAGADTDSFLLQNAMEGVGVVVYTLDCAEASSTPVPCEQGVVTDSANWYSREAQDTAARQPMPRAPEVDDTPTISAALIPGAPATPPTDETYKPATWTDPALHVTERIDAEVIEAAVKAETGNRFGGAWITTTDKLALGVIDPTPADQAVIAGVSSDVVLVPVTYNAAQLASWQEAATTLLNANAVRPAMVGADFELNAVEVDVQSLSASTRAALVASMPATALHLVEDPSFSFSNSHGDRFNWLALGYVHQEAGLAVKYWPTPNTVGECTTAWYVYNDYYGGFGTTAGHCGDHVGESITAPENCCPTGGDFADSVRNDPYLASNPSDADVLSFSTASIWNYPRVQNQSSLHWNVMGTFSASYPTKGERDFCWSGRSTNNDVCGLRVTAANINVIGPDGRTVRHETCIGGSTIPGDSGGPMYRLYSNGTVRAMGVIRGNGTGGAAKGVCGSHVAWVTQTLSSRVVTQ